MPGYNNIVRYARKDFTVHKDVSNADLKKELDEISAKIDGGGGQPGPDTVGTDQIINGAVKMEDLNQEVIDRMTEVYDESTGTLYANGSRPNKS